jgi:hypothetical protein
VAAAGMVWSKMDEEAQGRVFWYDPISYQGDHLTKKQLSELFQWLSNHFVE